MSMRKDALWVANLILIWLVVFAENSLPSSEGNGTGSHQYRCVRPMGMGNAFVAIADDGDAFYYNPAGLTAVRKIRIDLQPIKFIPTQDLYDEFEDLDQLMDDVEAIRESAQPLSGKGMQVYGQAA
jgi:hypothetical protein